MLVTQNSGFPRVVSETLKEYLVCSVILETVTRSGKHRATESGRFMSVTIALVSEPGRTSRPPLPLHRSCKSTVQGFVYLIRCEFWAVFTRLGPAVVFTALYNFVVILKHAICWWLLYIWHKILNHILPLVRFRMIEPSCFDLFVVWESPLNEYFSFPLILIGNYV
jgi:hypothetical protein